METELNGVLGSYNRLVYEDLKEIDQTLTQVGQLTADAGDKLYSGLDEIGSLLAQEHEAVLSEDRTALEPLLQQNREAFMLMKGQMLRSMQVTDMVHQLLGHCRTRMNRINKMSGEVERVAEQRLEAISRMVQEMQLLLEETRNRMDDEVGKSVEQITVDEGDVQFF